MDRVFESGAIGLAPTVPAVPSVGFPTGGNPVGGVPATKPGAHWFHMVTEELRALIVAAGLTPSASVVDQVLQALPGALASRPEMARSLAAAGYQRLPGGLILQWGSLTTPAASGSQSVTFPIAFPTACRFATTSGISGTINVAGNDGGWTVLNLTTTSFLIQNNWDSTTSPATLYWFALGH